MTTTTSRSRKVKPDTAIPLDVDLDGFSAQIEEHTGMVGIAERFRAYRRHSDVVAALGSRSEAKVAVRARLDLEIASGRAFIQQRPVRRVSTGGKAKRALRSENVQKGNPGLWADARVAVRQLSIKSPAVMIAPIPVPRMRTMAETWDAYERLNARARSASAAAAIERDKLGEMFDRVADVWPVTAVYRTTDGWTLGRKEMLRFNEGRCRELAAERGVDLTGLEVETTTAVAVRYVLVTDDDDEFDEIDGE